jgi:hypothetical protein
MESVRFDDIVRALGSRSRRRVLAGLAGAILAAVAPRRGSAACQSGTHQEGPCGTRECIDGEFVDFFEDRGTVCRAATNECDLAEVCSGSSIACPTDRKKVNGAACSSDGNSCTFDICQNGQCTHPVKPDREECDDDGNECTLDICLSGVCTHQPFVDGAICSSGRCCGAKCLNTQTDEANCGACGIACATGQTCCSGKCVSLLRDRANCGACGKRCRKGSCVNGRCKKKKKKKH